MAIVSLQCNKLHLLIKQIREFVAIVLEQCIYTYLLIQKTRKGVAIVPVQCIKLHLREGVAIASEHVVYKLYIYSLVNLKDKRECGYCLSTMT